MFMLKISYARFLRLGLFVILAQLTLEICVAAWNREKFTKTPYLEGSRSFEVIGVGTSGKFVGCACYDTQQVCVYLQPFLR